MLSPDFTSNFWFYDYHHIIAAYILPYHLYSIPSVSCFYLIIPWVFPTWYHLLYFYLRLYLVLTTLFLMHVYDSDLSIHVCLSLHATWHSPYHSLGISDSRGSSCSGLEAWSLWILAVADPNSAVVAWIIGILSETLSFQTPCSFLEFSLCNSWASFCTVLYCIFLCILAFACRWCNILIILCHI